MDPVPATSATSDTSNAASLIPREPARRTPIAELDQEAQRLAEQAHAFARTPPAQKAELLRAILPRLLACAPEQVRLACRYKGLDPTGPFAGEEWLAGPFVVASGVRQLAESLEDIARRGHPARPGLRARRDGRLEARISPPSFAERAATMSYEASVLFREGTRREDVISSQARFYRAGDPEGGVSLILGAGNVASIAPLDALHKLFVEGKVAIVKMSPVNEYLGPLFEQAFAPLIERGYLRVVYGGAEEGAYLATHRAITDLHITGSSATHDALVWGPPGPERERRKAEGDPVLNKPISSELGNISPVIIAPYPYDKGDLWFIARNVASQVVNNASFNCNAAKMLVLPAGWDQRDLFLSMLEKALALAPPRRAYYPGATSRHAHLTEGRSAQRRVGEAGEGVLPWTIVTDLDPRRDDEPLFCTEPFCAILSAVSVGTRDPFEFLAAATAFCNERLWGTLAASIIVPPVYDEDPALASALEQAIVGLRYGAVCVNHWPGLVYGMVTLPWGGHPSATLADVKSGIGFVHNTLMLEHIEKAVLRAPLRVSPKPPYFIDHRRMAELGERLTRLAAAPGLGALMGVAAAAARG